MAKSFGTLSYILAIGIFCMSHGILAAPRKTEYLTLPLSRYDDGELSPLLEPSLYHSELLDDGSRAGFELYDDLSTNDLEVDNSNNNLLQDQNQNQFLSKFGRSRRAPGSEFLGKRSSAPTINNLNRYWTNQHNKQGVAFDQLMRGQQQVVVKRRPGSEFLGRRKKRSLTE